MGSVLGFSSASVCGLSPETLTSVSKVSATSLFSPDSRVGAKHPRPVKKGEPLWIQGQWGKPPLHVGDCEDSIMAGLGVAEGAVGNVAVP